MKGYTKKDYLEAKQELISSCANGKMPTLQQIEIIRMLGGKWAENDPDLVWLKIDIITKHYTKKMPSKKASALFAETQKDNLTVSTAYSTASLKLYRSYLDSCNRAGKRSKTTKIVCAITACCLLILGAVGVYFGDKTGMFYGNQAITFFADGQEYTQSGAVKYNNYVQVDIPTKKGYDAIGIIDTKTQKQLFDATGKSLSVVSNRDLSDYENYNLEVQYEPHVYSVQVMTAKNVALASVAYTVEDNPENILDEPQYLEGYVFAGWYTDAKFKNPFTGDFMDYADLNEPLVLYPYYSLDGWAITWDLQGGEFITDVLNEYTILTDVPLPTGDVVKKEGYELKGWALNGKPIGYFTPTIMCNATLSAIWEAKEYLITVCPNNGDSAYTQKVKYNDYYALTTPAYKGHTFIEFKLGAQAIPLFGIYSFTTDIVVSADYSVNTYNIIYVSDGETIGKQEVAYGKAFSLRFPTQKPNHEFSGWYDKPIGGNQISAGIYNNDGDMVVYASWIKVLTIRLESGKDYTIDKTVEKVYVVGNYTGANSVMTSVCIKVSTRDNDLTMHLINVGFKAKNDCVAVNCENSSYHLTVLVEGINCIIGGNGSRGFDGVSGNAMTESNCNGTRGNDGQHALNCGRVSFEGVDKKAILKLKSGDSGDGGNGGIQHKAGSFVWTNYQPNGGNSGDVKSALNCITYSTNGLSVSFESGTIGTPGVKGSRDRWFGTDYGKDGIKGICMLAVSYK